VLVQTLLDALIRTVVWVVQRLRYRQFQVLPHGGSQDGADRVPEQGTVT